MSPTSLQTAPPQTAPPRIGYVLKRYPRYSETFIVNEILAHEAAGQPLEIFALRPVEETHFQDNLGKVRAPVTRLTERLKNPDAFWRLMLKARAGLPASSWALLGRMTTSGGQDVAQALELALACRERGVAHLHAHFGTVSTTVARLAAQLAGIGYSFTAHAKDIYFDYDENIRLDEKLRDAAHVVTVSDYNVDYLDQRFGPAAGTVSRIYNGLDLDRFAYAAPAPDATDILAVGRLVEKKGFHILIEAMRLLRDGGRTTRCRIVGGGDEVAYLAAQIAAAGLDDSVEMLGPRPQSEVMAMMRAAAVFACPCVVGRDGNRDGLPTVLLEAMALGTPCVATAVTGIPELVRDGETGLCVPEGDPQALATALARMLDDAALRQRVSTAGRALIEREFDQHVNAARLRAIWQDAIAGSGQPQQRSA
ncbi:glycosyltransferase family 4 protein [Paracoccus gahaiensis]|uniref:Glycosyltransferase family 4 protein n=1 Tax=Paracoccus gahaiensis TaxID=1706839 RepID=A0A4U0R4S5_9RHOB|nr:glycosyltransferase family 4 protein [Paracoccus gahaiensis]TJZ89869.1 glycosyltransferase family 4 protein [Paracoccus gahaiensis]